MKNLLDKFNRENSAFILVQFIGLAIAVTSALVLNVWSAIANSPVAKEAAILAASFGFMVAGLCDFFIHRGATYPKMIALIGEEMRDSLWAIHEYEEMKPKHSRSGVVGWSMVFVWINVTRFIWDGNFTDFTVLRMTHLIFLYSIASLLFMFGAKAGSTGWGFLVGKPGYINEIKSSK